MLTLFKKLFGKSEPQHGTPVSTPVHHHEPVAVMPSVEMAHLSLTAIIERLPEDLKPMVVGTPAPEATVGLPVATIMKQLPTGAVKMSFATLHRQAPPGVFAILPQGEKRMVDVPLGEVFRHVSPSALKRRPDQRPAYVPDSSYDLFGNSENPFEISAPREDAGGPNVLDLSAEAAEPPRRTTLPFPRAAAAPAAGGKSLAPPPGGFNVGPTASAPKPAAPKSDLPPLVLPLEPLLASWPEELKHELAALAVSATVSLPADQITAGLARGKVAFTWGELRGWIEPPCQSPGPIADHTTLILPLKVVAPAFLAATKRPKAERKAFEAENLPSLFSDGRPPAPAEAPVPVEAEAPAPVVEAPAIEAAPEPAPEPPKVLKMDFQLAPATPPPAVEEPPAQETPAPEEQPPVAETAPTLELVEPAEEAPTLSLVPEPEPEPAAEAEADSQVIPFPAAPEEPVLAGEESAPVFQAPEPAITEVPPASPAPVTAGPEVLPATVGEIFGLPDKVDWTPAELVSHVVYLPGISGAVVSLQEGLLVAHSLPGDVKGEVVAAFLPQIFARLNQYAGEMKLGEVDDLLFTTRGAPCQIYRIGYVYFAVLGKPGEPLPWHELRLIADNLAQQTHQS